MQLLDGRVILSPTDLVGFLACPRLTQLDLAVLRGELVRPVREDPMLDLLVRRGQPHEAAHRAMLEARGLRVVEIPDFPSTLEGLRNAETATLEAMRGGADIVYQAAFFDGTWRGRADFLYRIDMPCDLGGWSYAVLDAKLAWSPKESALIQVTEYSLQVWRNGGA
jgi:uncharacterized protein